jgi:hypothetical protein
MILLTRTNSWVMRSIRDQLRALRLPFRIAGVDTIVDRTHWRRHIDAASRAVQIVLEAPDTCSRIEPCLELIEAAHHAQVRHFVLLSTFAVRADAPIAIGRCAHEIEQYLDRSAAAVTVLRPSLLMQSLLEHSSSIAAHGELALPLRDRSYNFVDARDVGAVAAAVLAQTASAGTLELRGPRNWSYREVATEMTAVLSRPIEYRDICAPRYQGALERAGMREATIRARLDFCGYAAEGGLDTQPNDVIESWLHRPAITLATFLHDYRGEFLPQRTRRSAQSA